MLLGTVPPWHFLPHKIFCGGLASVIASAVVLGLGSRLAMRIVALLNGEAEGTLTDGGETVGAITAGGTIGLVIFGGALSGFLQQQTG